jgi:hypothetical protein
MVLNPLKIQEKNSKNFFLAAVSTWINTRIPRVLNAFRGRCLRVRNAF